MKQRNKSVLAGKIETPVDINEHHIYPDLAQDHVAFDHEGATQTTEFDYAEIDAALGLVAAAPPDVRQQAGELIRELFQFCFGTRRKIGGHELKTAALRLAVIVSSIRPDVCNNMTHGELAAQLGRTRAAASKAVCAFEDKHGLKFQRTRSQDARLRMAQARLANPVARNKKPAVVASNQTVTTEQAEGGAAFGSLLECKLIPWSRNLGVSESEALFTDKTPTKQRHKMKTSEKANETALYEK